MNNILDSSAVDDPLVTDFHAPLLSPESISSLRRMDDGQRWPNVKLMHLQLDLCEAERAVHVAQVVDDANALAAAQLKRSEVRSALTAECEAVADTFLTGLSHALQYKPHEVEDLAAAIIASKAVRATIVLTLDTILKPLMAWFNAQQSDLSERLDNLEVIAAGEAVRT